MDWKHLAATSHYQTAVAIGRELANGRHEEAAAGIQELVEAVSRAERRALRSQLIRLMAHIIKWKEQPIRRSASWAVTICQAREEIAAIQEETPSLGRKTIEAMWDYCFKAAKREAEAETKMRLSTPPLTWTEVFDAEYFVGDQDESR